MSQNRSKETMHYKCSIHCQCIDCGNLMLIPGDLKTGDYQMPDRPPGRSCWRYVLTQLRSDGPLRVFCNCKEEEVDFDRLQEIVNEGWV